MEQNLVINHITPINPKNKPRTYYCRSNSNQQTILSTLLNKIHHNALNTIIVPSGMAAIYTTLNAAAQFYSNKNYKLNLIISDELYSDTPKVCDQIAKLYNMTLYTVDITNDQQIITTFVETNTHANTYNIFYFESCSNPNGKMINTNIIDTIKKIVPNIYIIVDNTWLTHLAMGPFTSIHNCNAIVLSLTKYYSGGTAIAGAIIIKETKDNDITPIIYNHCKTVGYHVSPHNCQMILANMSTYIGLDINSYNQDLLKLRLAQGYKNTLFALEYLTKIKGALGMDKIIDVKHPSLTNSHNIMLYQNTDTEGNTYGPCVFPVYVLSSINKITKGLESLTNIKYETSFGHPYNTIDNFPKSVMHLNPKTQKPIRVVRIRFAIGYLATEKDIIDMIDEFTPIL